MAWIVTEYDSVLTAFMFGFATDKELTAEVFLYIKKLQESGTALDMPYSEFLEDGIFQLRPHKKKKQARLLYFFSKAIRYKATIVHCFFKTTPTTPREAITLAKDRREELEPKGRKRGH